MARLPLVACALLILLGVACGRTSDIDKTALLAFKAALVTDQVRLPPPLVLCGACV